MKLEAQWIVGFTDGEGYFHISILKNDEMSVKYQVLPEFIIVQHKRDIQILYALKNFFQCGIVRNNKGKLGTVMAYRVRNKSHLLNTIIPFFEKHQLKTVKNIKFKKFRDVLLMMEKNEHLTEEGLNKIREIKQSMSKIEKI